MKYEQIRNLLDEPFRRLTGVKRQTYVKGRELIVRIVSIPVKMAQRKN